MDRSLPRALVRIGLIAAIVLGLAASVASSPAFALPSSSDYGPSIDPYASHESPTQCLSISQPGVVDFRKLLQEKYGANDGGILRSCNVGGDSDHKEGRAYDWMLDANSSRDRAKADEVLDWLLSTDNHGNTHAMARRLGISYIIWDHQWWASWRPHDGWRPYTGWHPHDDHIHFSFSWAGALQQTTYWTGTGPFPDVAWDAYYAAPVTWMIEHAITNGMGTTGMYEPHLELTRAQMSAFLWRTMDRPTGYPDHGFSDVPQSSYYENPVRWLTAEGITDGFGKTGLFKPHETVTRGQMAAFLWRTTGEPSPSSTHDFPDVSSTNYYHDAVSWMAEHGITDGWGNTGRYEPDRAVTRAQASAFLHRLATTEAAWHASATIPSTASF